MIDRFGQFTNGILKISKTWNKVAAEEMKAYGLHASHVHYLIVLKQNPKGLTSQEIIDIIQKDKSDVSRLLNSLIKSGLVKKESIHQRGYGGTFSLTERGDKVAEEVGKKVRTAVGLANANIPADKLGIFYEVLEALNDNISKIRDSDLNVEDQKGN